jgi:hypothetical protein
MIIKRRGGKNAVKKVAENLTAKSYQYNISGKIFR